LNREDREDHEEYSLCRLPGYRFCQIKRRMDCNR